jgi:uncharacterized protein (TIGR00251 family)
MLENLIKELKAKGDLYIRVKVRPGAGKTEVKEIMEDGTVKIALAAQPVKGQANRELIKFLSEIFKCKKTQLIILSGKADKTKLIKISCKL